MWQGYFASIPEQPRSPSPSPDRKPGSGLPVSNGGTIGETAGVRRVTGVGAWESENTDMTLRVVSS